MGVGIDGAVDNRPPPPGQECRVCATATGAAREISRAHGREPPWKKDGLRERGRAEWERARIRNRVWMLSPFVYLFARARFHFFVRSEIDLTIMKHVYINRLNISSRSLAPRTMQLAAGVVFVAVRIAESN